eukprot:scaffold91491_cov23-Cyclotella_meneghiniana.AAC.1
MQSVKTHEGQGPNLNTIPTLSTSLLRHRRFHHCSLLRPCVALSDVVCMLAFDCCVWPVVALMLYLDFRDVGGIVQILPIKESSQSDIPMLPVLRKLLMTIKLTQHTSIWKTTYIRPVHAGV